MSHSTDFKKDRTKVMMRSGIMKGGLARSCYRLVLLMVQDVMRCLYRTKRAQLIQKSCLCAGAAAHGPGAQVNRSQGGTGEDGTG